MADAIYTLGIDVLYDNSELEAGVRDAEAAIGGLEGATSEAAAGMSAALDSTGTAAAGLGTATETAATEMDTALTAAGTSVDELATGVDTAAGAIDTSLGTVKTTLDGLGTETSTVADTMETDMVDVAAAIAGVGDEAATTATEVAASFSTIGTSVDTAGTQILNTSDKKLKTVGKTVGTNFAAAMTSGIQSGDVFATVTTLGAGLLAAGGLAGAGIALGATLVTGIIKGTQAEAEALRARVDDLLGAVENDFKNSLQSILHDINAGASRLEAIEAFGGIEEANKSAELLGLNIDQVSKVIQGNLGPGTDRLRRNLQKTADWTATSAQVTEASLDPALAKVLSKQTDMALRAQELLDAWGNTRGAIDKAEHEAGLLYDVQHRTLKDTELLSDAQSRLAESTGVYADAMERANQAALQLAGRRLPSGAHLAGIGP